MPRYVEFAAASNFSFLRGASHPEELMLQAAALGLSGLGLCDRNSVAGVVRAHLIKREQKLALAYHPGTRLVFADGTPDILAYPRDRAGWGRLCRLLTRGNLRARKGQCILYLDDLIDHIDGLELIVMERSTWELSELPVVAQEVDSSSHCNRPLEEAAIRASSVPSPLVGEGTGRGVTAKLIDSTITPLPTPPPQGGREQTEQVARQLHQEQSCDWLPATRKKRRAAQSPTSSTASPPPPPAACGWRPACSIAATTARGSANARRWRGRRACR